MGLTVNVLPASNGECIWIRYGEEDYTNIIVDAGPASSSKGFRDIIDKIVEKGEVVDLLILTHIDDDHIKGFVKYIEKRECTEIKEIWLNGEPKESVGYQTHSAKNIGSLVEVIKAKKMNITTPILQGKVKPINDGEIVVITPTQDAVDKVATEIAKYTPHSSVKRCGKTIDQILEKDKFELDTSDTNKASISFVFSYKGESIAFLGDAYPGDVIEGKNKYCQEKNISLVKLAHHGSKYNTNLELLECMQTDKFIISRKSLGYKETIARIIKSTDSAIIYCNYNWWDEHNIFNEEDKIKYIDTKKIQMICQNEIIIL